MTNVFISIVNFNGIKNTVECLKSIDNLNLEDIKLGFVVVDNASIDNSVGTLKNLKLKTSNLKIIENKENLGFSGGHNVGIKYALGNEADYVVVLNNDVILDKNLVKKLVDSAREDSSVGAISPKIYFAPGFEFHKDRYRKEDLGKVIWYAGGNMDWNNLIGKHGGVDEVDKGQFEKRKETDFASGCCMLIKKEVFEKAGYFNEKYFLYYEDNDFSQRTRSKGYKIIYEPKAILWHKNAGSVGGSGSGLQDYFITRNRLVFGMAYASMRTKFALLRESIKILLNGRKWQKRGVLDFYFRRFGRGSYK